MVQFKGFACTYFLCSMKNVDAVSSSVALLSCQEMQQHQEFHTAPNPSLLPPLESKLRCSWRGRTNRIKREGVIVKSGLKN